VRASTGLTLGLFAFGLACGSKSETPDAGPADAGSVDAGPVDSGVVVPVCLDDAIDSGSEDAGIEWDGGYDFSCRGQASASGGQAQLDVSGKVTRAGFTRTPLADVQVDLLRRDGMVLATAISDDAGIYALSFDAGCAVLDAEVRATSRDVDAGFHLTYALPPAPFSRDRAALELVLFDESTKTLVAALANVAIVDAGAVLAMRVGDCGGHGIEGAVVSVDAGTVRYVGTNGLPSSVLTSTTATGDVIIFNLPGSSVAVTAFVDGGVVGQRVVPVHADAVSSTTLRP
jgi:hypothetical protein